MNKFEQLGFTEMDAFLIVTCIGAACIGSMIDYIIKREDFTQLEKKEQTELPFSRYMPLILGRVVLGASGGITVYLLLSGSLTLDKSGFTRLIILSAMAGFAAPVIAKKYENKVPSVFK